MLSRGEVVHRAVIAAAVSLVALSACGGDDEQPAAVPAEQPAAEQPVDEQPVDGQPTEQSADEQPAATDLDAASDLDVALAALESLGGEGNVLVVDLDGERFEFDGQYCVTISTHMSQQTVGNVPSGQFELRSKDSEEPVWISLEIGEIDPDTGQRTQWSAGGDRTGMLARELSEASQIDSYTVSTVPSDRGEYLFDYFAEGTATFVNVTEYWKSNQIITAPGTFEAACVK